MSVLSMFEGGSVGAVAHEFKAMDVFITEEIFNDKDRWKELVDAFVQRIMDNACAALNARVDMTLHLGIDDEGHVHGIRVEKFYLVNTNKFPVHLVVLLHIRT